ncbi:DUF302 domain-containing protein [Moraxella equi]|uniref:Uncharacterized conserved protein n=1 Tax=Moraxella equi TaxID=60442 RepID=A0A378QWA3_9GAMM|nr:DUF302 domain-containing protein [Moraxella equi]OPH38024.1 hypothetical protein B5J93_07135 [Moraxella equi]STZ04574.1 Uncharacterized conserved protein [Moraxella equi]
MKIFALPLLALALSLGAYATTNPVHEPTKATAMTHATLISPYDFNTTIHRLKSTIESKGMTVFAVIDHAKSAQEVGMDMQPATVLIYGNPKAGTPLMQKDPAFALALPLKVLITETNGQVQVIYTPADELIKGSQIQPSDVANTLANAEKLIKTVLGQ